VVDSFSVQVFNSDGDEDLLEKALHWNSELIEEDIAYAMSGEDEDL
jgi:hypothetical protein